MTNEERDNLDKLLLVFVHGFRGSDSSFKVLFILLSLTTKTNNNKKDFPNRLQTILTNTVKADVNAVVYPSYKTAG